MRFITREYPPVLIVFALMLHLRNQIAANSTKLKFCPALLTLRMVTVESKLSKRPALRITAVFIFPP